MPTALFWFGFISVDTEEITNYFLLTYIMGWNKTNKTETFRINTLDSFCM